jgi:hypothetical protein
MGGPWKLRVVLWIILVSNAISTKVVELAEKITPVVSVLI